MGECYCADRSVWSCENLSYIIDEYEGAGRVYERFCRSWKRWWLKDASTIDLHSDIDGTGPLRNPTAILSTRAPENLDAKIKYYGEQQEMDEGSSRRRGMHVQHGVSIAIRFTEFGMANALCIAETC